MSDDLSQWRAYCRGGGFALGFPRATLDAIAREPEWLELDPGNRICKPKWLSLERCVYEKDEQEAMIKRTVEDTLQAMFDPESNTTSAQSQNERQEWLTPYPLYWQLTQTAAALKHKAFAGEKEWRLVVMPRSDPDETERLRFRCRGGLVVPYWPIELKADSWDSVVVVVGPTPHPEESRASIERLLSCRCHYNCITKVRVSEVPYRDW